MPRYVVPGGPPPCFGRSELFLRPSEETSAQRAPREAAAKAICATCDERAACLELAIDNRRRHGSAVDVDIYGGLTPAERLELVRSLPLVPA